MRIAAILMALLLSSCSPAPMHLKVSQVGETFVGEVYKKWWFNLRSGEVPCVHDVELTDTASKHLLWRMVVDPEQQCANLRKFVLGEAARGFRDEVRLAKPVSPGSYKLRAYGIGYGSYAFTLPLSP